MRGLSESLSKTVAVLIWTVVDKLASLEGVSWKSMRPTGLRRLSWKVFQNSWKIISSQEFMFSASTEKEIKLLAGYVFFLFRILFIWMSALMSYRRIPPPLCLLIGALTWENSHIPIFIIYSCHKFHVHCESSDKIKLKKWPNWIVYNWFIILFFFSRPAQIAEWRNFCIPLFTFL